MNLGVCEGLSRVSWKLSSTVRKYPPAEPEALRVAAPSKGAYRDPTSKPLAPSSMRGTVGSQNRSAHITQTARTTEPGILPELSNFGCLPGKAGGTPISLGPNFVASA